MSMSQPQLWSESSDTLLEETNKILKKYQHLIKWKENESILEFGFAGGKNSVETLGRILQEDYKEFCGTDINENMIDYAKQHCKLKNSKFFTLDIAADTIPQELENRFDHIFSFSVIHLVKSPKKAFSNIYKMLKPNGIMFHTFFDRIPVDYAFDILSKDPKWSKYNQEEMLSPYHHTSNPEEHYKNDLNEAGFKDFHFGVEKGMFHFKEDQFDNLLMAVNVVVPRIPQELLEEYKKRYLELMYENPVVEVKSKENGKCVYVNYTMLVVCATKKH